MTWRLIKDPKGPLAVPKIRIPRGPRGPLPPRIPVIKPPKPPAPPGYKYVWRKV